MIIRMLLIIIITFTMFFSLWKTSVGLIGPLACLWGYGWVTGFADIDINSLLILSGVHLAVQTLAWWLSSCHREANLAYTAAGVVGFATGILASLFFGKLLGSLMWWGAIGRLVTEPVAIGVKPIAKSFAGGVIKVVYSTIASGVIAYMLF